MSAADSYPAPGPEPAKSRPLVQVERLSKLYPIERGWFRKPRFLRAVDSVTLYVKKGETLGLVGESGCGKTTLGRCVLRLIEPTYGKLSFDGHNLAQLTTRQMQPLRRRMQVVFQDPYGSLNPRMRVGDIVGEGLRVHKLARTKRDYEQRLESVLHDVELPTSLVSRYPHELSAGQRQRVAIARALALEPEFVVCDEPVSALDVSAQGRVLALLQHQQQQRKLSYLLISHDLRVVRELSHRVAVMYMGKLVEVGTTEQVFAHPLHPYTRALLAAMPVPDPDQRRLRIVLEGEPPDPTRPPSGCPFHPRCPRNDQTACIHDQPLLDEIAAGSHHRVACWHPDD